MLNSIKFTSAGFRLARMMSHLTSSEAAKVTWKEIRIPVPWGHIAGKEWGHPNGEPILGLHGWQDNSATFDGLAPLLPLSQLRFICLDLPGHGLSSHYPTGSWYRWTDYLTTIARVVDYFKWEKFSMIGHSMGGKIAMLYAGTFPEKIEHLVSLDMMRPFPGGSRVLIERQEGDYTSWNWALIYRSFIEFTFKLEASKRVKTNNNGRPMEELVNRMMAATSDWNFMTPESARVILNRGTRLVSKNPDLYELLRDPHLGVYDMNASVEVLSQFCQQMTCNLMVILPDQGLAYYHPPALCKNIKINLEKMKGYQVVNISGTHHEHLNNPQKVAPIIGNFLLSQS